MVKSGQFRQGQRFWTERPKANALYRGANISHAASHNRKILLHTIRARGTIGRLELAELTGLTPPAVFKIAGELIEQRLVVTAPVKERGRGQPTLALSLNPDAALAFGLTIDRGQLTFILADFAGRVRMRFHLHQAFSLPGDVRAFVADCVEKVGKSGMSGNSAICGLGVAFPDDLGTVQLPDQPAAYTEWNGVDLELLLGDLVPGPVLHENDAACAAIGEMHFGAGLSLDTFFYLYLSAGLGGGLVVNRQYVRGAHGRSGEIGFLPTVNPLKQRRTNLQKCIGESILFSDFVGDHPDAFPTSPTLPFAYIDQQPDEIVEPWITSVADILYLPLLTILCTVDPDAILMGGYLPTTVADRLCFELNRRLSMNVGIHWPRRAVRRATVVEDAAAVGAAVLALQTIWEPPVS